MNKALKNLIIQTNKKNADEDKVICLYEDIPNTNVQRVTTGLPSLDYIMGGGQPLGRIIEIFGPSSSGKTTTCIKMLIEIQREFPDEYQVIIDVEHAFDGEYARKLGLDMKRIIFSQPNSAETALDLLQSFAGAEGVRAILFDSLAQMPTAKEVEGKSGDSEMGMRARLLSQALRKLPSVVRKNNSIVYLTNQVRLNIGQMYGNPEVTPGGEGPKFATSIRIRTTIKKDQKDPTFGVTGFNIIKNKVGVPFRKTEIKMLFGKGFDATEDLLTLAMTLRVIYQAGSSYSYKDFKCVGKEKLKVHFLEDEDFRNDIREAVGRVDNTRNILNKALDNSIIDNLSYGKDKWENGDLMFKDFLESPKKLEELDQVIKNTLI